ncbi:formate dehydrogenase subunit alpha [Halarchaeum nitratireducens]|uniref:4Fe-4S Mo/W bis-MGD-type domain-containing protein n=1 Tax=Halarchaeum nitratireducens TaxID=489913 RepID=A0A830G7C7_9EURY|nr:MULTISPECIES: formate dehydrogenase subunit alpha [Halarchaeum]MBP2250026.1 formate dehydrogenase major subunit [Halarchaeum solikamskense]GGN09028.1 hypothetical protein GCM10009021_05580 [Halarchaeum nitratireducens]
MSSNNERKEGVAGFMQRAKEQANRNVEHFAEGMAAGSMPEGKLFDIAQQISDKRLGELTVDSTTCGYCAVGCRFDVYTDGEEVLATRAADPEESPVNDISTCVKGKFSYNFANSDQRLTDPLVRDENGEWREATWEEALSRTVEGFRDIIDEYGNEAMSVIASSKATNEENYLMGKFARQVLGTNTVDNCNRLCHSSTVAGLAKTYGYGAASISVKDFEEADLIFLTGSNTTEAHPVLGTRVKQHVKEGGDLIVFDPRETQIAEYADQYTSIRPGYDTVWVNGLTRYIIENDLYDEEFVAERTEGFEEVKEAVDEFTLDYVEEVTGASPEEIVSAAEAIAEADRTVFGWTLGITEHSHGTDNVASLANLAAITGNVGKPGTGVSPFRGQNNVQGGGGDMGPLPDNFPGYQKVADDEIRAKFEEAWDCEIPAERGYYTTEMFNAFDDGELRGMFCIGENPSLSEPGKKHADEVLEEMEFLVVQDLFMNETAKYADVVLPAVSFLEKEGTFANTDRRVQKVNQVLEKKGNAKADWEILQELANRMGREWDYADTNEINEEMRSLTPIYGGISHERIEEEGGIQWPCWDEDHPGTERLYTEEFNTESGKANLTPVGYAEPMAPQTEELPLTLTTGRVLYQYHTGTMTHPEEGIMKYNDRDFVEINPDTAAAYGIENGDPVRIESDKGEIVVTAQVTERIGEDTVFAPIHFAETAVNTLTDSERLDPEAKTPEFKATAVRISPVEGQQSTSRPGSVEPARGDD